MPCRYRDHGFRRSVAAFWSTTWSEKSFQKQLRDSRKLEELIIHFVTSATKSLRKGAPSGPNDLWIEELNAQTCWFLDVLADVIQATASGSTELLLRVSAYRHHIKVNDGDRSAAGSTDHQMTSVNTADDLAHRTLGGTTLEGGTRVQIAKRMFRIPDLECTSLVQHLARLCTTQVNTHM